MNVQTSKQPRNAARAATESVSGDRLLLGERPDSRFLEDALHWRSVYSELIAFKDMLIEAMEQRLANMSDQARDEAAGIDLTLTRAQLAHYQKRFDFWNERVAVLETNTKQELQAARR